MKKKLDMKLRNAELLSFFSVSFSFTWRHWHFLC